MKDHRIRLRDEDLKILTEALEHYIEKYFEGLTEAEIEDLKDSKVERAIELWDRFQILAAGRPRRAGAIIKDKNKPIFFKKSIDQL